MLSRFWSSAYFMRGRYPMVSSIPSTLHQVASSRRWNNWLVTWWAGEATSTFAKHPRCSFSSLVKYGSGFDVPSGGSESRTLMEQPRLEWKMSAATLECCVDLRPVHPEAHDRLSRADAHLGMRDEARQQMHCNRSIVSRRRKTWTPACRRW
jgi:hypothetical protein